MLLHADIKGSEVVAAVLSARPVKASRGNASVRTLRVVPTNALPEVPPCAAAAPATKPLRIAVLDRDSGFVRVLAKRIEDLAWDHVEFGAAAQPKRLIDLTLDAVVIDLELLGPKSWRWLGRLLDASAQPAVIVCTAAPFTREERVRAFRLGVDDWLRKPCHPEELIARVEAVVRQRRRRLDSKLRETIVLGELEIRPTLFQAFVRDTNLNLTRREFRVIEVLAQEPGTALKRELIYERVWGMKMSRNDRAVDVVVHKLRRKLLDASPLWRYIHTHPTVGYRFAPISLEGGVPSERPGPAR